MSKLFCADCREQKYKASVYTNAVMPECVDGLGIVDEDEGITVEFNKDGGIKKVNVEFYDHRDIAKFVNISAIEKYIRSELEQTLKREDADDALECLDCGSTLMEEKSYKKEIESEENRDEARLCELLDEVQAVKERLKVKKCNK